MHSFGTPRDQKPGRSLDGLFSCQSQRTGGRPTEHLKRIPRQLAGRLIDNISKKDINNLK